MHFVEQLFFDRHQIHRTARAFHFSKYCVAVGFNFGNRKCEIPRFGNIFKSWIAEVAAGHLRAAFHEVSNAVAASEFGVVKRIPAEFIHHRRHENRRIGNTTGDDNLRALFECGDDRFCAEIDFSRNQIFSKARSRLAVFQNRVGEIEHAIGNEATGYGGDFDAARTEFLEQLYDALCSAGWINPTLIADDFGTAFNTGRQHRLHAIVKIGVVARKIRIAPRAYLCGRNRRLRHGFEAQIIQVALLGI